MKKLLTSLLAAALAVQCGAVCSFAAATVTVGEKQNLFTDDFSGELSWDVTRSNTNYGNAAQASIVTDSALNKNNLIAPYLKVSNSNNNATADTITLTKGFTVTETGIVRASFKWSSDVYMANADVRLTDDSGNGIIIGSATTDIETNIITAPVEIEGETQTPYSGGKYCVYVCTKSGDKYKSYALGEAYDNDLAIFDTSFAEAWRNIEIVANTSSHRVNTTIAGRDISLGSGVYAVSMNHKVGSDKSNLLKGYLPEMDSFSKFSVMSKGYLFQVSGVETRIDDVSVDFEPVTVVDTSYLELPINDTFDGTAGALPAGWTSNLSENSDARYVKVSNEDMGGNTAHLRIHKNDNNSADKITVDRAFEIPADGALININFDYLTANEQKGYGKEIYLMSGDEKAVIVEHKHVNGDKVVLTDKDDTDSVNWPATVLGDELSQWRHFDFTINCSNAELGGLGAGEYVLSFDNGEAVTGKLRGGVKTLDKIRFTSDVNISSDVCIDNMTISKRGFDSNAAYDVAMIKPETDSTDVITTAEGTTYNVGYIADIEGAYNSVIIEKKYGILKGLPLTVDLSGNSGSVKFGLQINGLKAEDEIQNVYISKRTIDFNAGTATVPGASSSGN